LAKLKKGCSNKERPFFFDGVDVQPLTEDKCEKGGSI
jgi:hypothetical protein